MKRRELVDLRKSEAKDLTSKVKEKKLELAKSRVKIVSGEEKNVKKVANLKKEIAQLLTIIREKELTQVETKEETK
ncbi:50S ribosomal protein L29 [Candidatus Woesebacteria bacterium RIFCSPHIGHO2_12_FULL_46_16]|uniref:Large ribosomal subunit protein uL29 n=3 Tax=Microgenomates group TaxID=1794810 RepID=A0A0H4TX59_9BACT|nr:50S ribosomal protein L29 [uncultured Microgenomates bacterium Rifle_16ft_4_minimus_37906]AKQ05569.1 50S ribosomal protein L29 [uncultured Microgenomates bacterium Rifle_16ft_4_minimus_24682]OGM57962.1 MAG: 50S ribosomal protein L29 [Candidatus Woesebacteria bacterium RIFCSPHIGHO2_12_FULL_46_16]